jgi:hypothetical protein
MKSYAGVIFTTYIGKDLNQNPTSNTFLVGGKGRLTISIPWVTVCGGWT